MLNVQVKTRKNGTDASWFRDGNPYLTRAASGPRIGTSARMAAGGGGDIVKAQQLAWIASYYIELQNEQLDAGLGSDGQEMPPLKVRGRVFTHRKDGVAQFRNRDTTRRLWGPGNDGHMRNDIRINYLDDRMAKVSITRHKSREKALANERKSPWWGLSPASAQKLAAAQAGVFGGAMEDWLDRLGLVQAGNYMVQLAQKLNRMRGNPLWTGRAGRAA